MWRSTSMASTATGWPCVCILWRSGCHVLCLHHPRHGYFDVIEVPMTDRAAEIGILVLGRGWCRHKLWRPFSVELTKWTKHDIDYVTIIVVNGVAWDTICFYCPFSWLKWIDIIYELKIRAVLWSVNKSIPQNFLMNRVLHLFAYYILHS